MKRTWVRSVLVAGAALLAGRRRGILDDRRGAGDMSRDEEKRFAEAMAKFAGGDKARPLVFLCVDAECWLSYNAARRAIAAGYTNVMWYRGGVAAWRAAGLAMAQADPFAW